MGSTIVTHFSQFDSYNSVIAWLTNVLGFNANYLVGFVLLSSAAFIISNVMAAIGGLGTYAERKISADIQMRQGPNRVGPYGILQFLADGIKMIGKEDIAPRDADIKLFYLAPLLCMIGVFGTLAVIPFSSGLALFHSDIGVFYISAIASLVGLGIFLGGYASNSKWSLLGGMRGASQIISYEIPVGISILAIVILTGSMNFKEIIAMQGGLPHQWLILHNPFSFIGFFVFFIGVLAETNRAPFDLPEAESELVSGYHTEYTGMRFGFFALAEYIEIFVVCGIAAALFLGGYNLPVDLPESLFVTQLLQVGTFCAKTLALYYVVIWIRWTMPRLRVDQLMNVCWKYLTPISLFNVVGSALWIFLIGDYSLTDLFAAFMAGSGDGGH